MGAIFSEGDFGEGYVPVKMPELGYTPKRKYKKRSQRKYKKRSQRK